MVLYNNINEFSRNSPNFVLSPSYMHQVFLSLGSNVGNRNENLKNAKLHLDQGTNPDTSAFLQFMKQNPGEIRISRNFYNQVVEIVTDCLNRLNCLNIPE